ncbi:hypothetical protein PGB90_005898 [Kerria lacca]
MGVNYIIFNHFILIFFFISLYHINAVDRSKFKTCDQSGFCKRLRASKPELSPFKIIRNSINVSSIGVEGSLVNADTEDFYSFLLQFLEDNTIRLRINENKIIRHRYQPLKALISEPYQHPFETIELLDDYLFFKIGSIKVKFIVSPLKLEIYNKDDLVIVANDLGKFVFEHYRPKPETINEENNKNGEWEERFHEHIDAKRFGPMAVGMDFSFPGATNIYGLPSHADSVSLKTTGNTDPYRLYNTDIFEYELNERMALYGAVPVIQAHGLNQTVGLFWLNAAETWVNVQKLSESGFNSNVMEKIVNLVAGGTKLVQNSGMNTHFMSETGILDVFFMCGPSFYDVTRQYSRLTGAAPLPPYFSLGYHQSRWNYNDQDDVKTVAENFDKYDIPLDVIWLDIEYTHDKKYFTWDPLKFNDPESMVHGLAAKGRKLVIIIDPHIKRDFGYFLHNDATHRGFYVKNKDGNDYEGWCWPGSSSYLDFLNPEVNEYYSSRYLLENFKGTSEDVHIWNDMNEPSVFNGPEVTMPKDCIHHGDWEHRDIHNIYGLFYVMATYDGLLKRSGGKKRPFILSRSFFSGTQRYAAIWTGDNMAEWGHLKMSIPMCLSSALGGISFCGADVGGFFGNPDKQLFSRWYQTGVYLPFYRAHSHIDTKRREPWLMGNETMHLIRNAIRERQSLMPLYYTLFYEHMQTGAPVIRPLVMEFPKEKETFDIDDQLLLGKSLLIKPVVEADVTHVDVYFPGANEIWYNKYTYQQVKTNGVKTIKISQNEIPVYIRGGSIIPIRNRIRRSSALTLHDPFTLIVALDINGTASGQLYLDDGESFEYRNGKYLLLHFTFLNNQLMSKIVDDGRFKTKAWIEKIIIIGIPNMFRTGIINSDRGQEELEAKYNTDEYSLTIRKPGVSVAVEWSISLL